MSARLANKVRTFSTLGDFWHKILREDDRPKIKTLALASRANPLQSLMAEASSRLAGRDWCPIANCSLRVHPSTVLRMGMDLQQRVLTQLHANSVSYTVAYRPLRDDLGLTGYHPLAENQPTSEQYCYQTEGCEWLLFPQPELTSTVVLDAALLREQFLVPIPPDLRITSIIGETRDMSVGLDFYNPPGVLVFFEDPTVLFPASFIHVRAGERRNPGLLNYASGTDGVPKLDHISRYLRVEKTTRALQLAAAQVAGLAILPWESRLREATYGCSGSTLVFEHGVVRCDYEHPELVVGQVYPKGYVVGEGIRMVGPGAPGWWREWDWSQGLSLDGFTPVTGLTVPDRPVRAWTDSQSTDYHVKLQLDGTPEALAAYWAYVKRREQETGRYLNAAVGLSSISDEKFVNPLNLLFDYAIDRRALLVEIDLMTVGEARRSAAVDFIQQHKPFGTVVIVRNKL